METHPEEMIKAAIKYDLIGLIRVLEDHIVEHMSINNLANIIHMTDDYDQLIHLTEAAKRFYDANLHAIESEETFVALPEVLKNRWYSRFTVIDSPFGGTESKATTVIEGAIGSPAFGISTMRQYTSATPNNPNEMGLKSFESPVAKDTSDIYRWKQHVPQYLSHSLVQDNYRKLLKELDI